MAEWSPLSDGWSLDSIDILRNLETNGFGLDDGKDQIARSFFDHILFLFLKEMLQKDEIRTTPPMLGLGQSVDLFKLYWVVRQKGGYHSVTSGRMWGAVAAEIGLMPDVSSPVKLVYCKYLYALDRWLRMVFDRKPVSGRALLVGLETEIKAFLNGVTDWKMDGWRLPESGAESKTVVDLVSGSGDAKQFSSGVLGKESMTVHCEKGARDAMIVNSVGSSKELVSQKRKRHPECVFGMLKWVIMIAKNPGDPAIGKILEMTTRGKAVGVKQYWDQLHLVRKMMFSRRPANLSGRGSLLQKRQRMHPSMYDEHNGADSTGRLRCSQRLLFLQNKSQSVSGSGTSSVPGNDVEDLENDLNKRMLRTIGSLDTAAVVDSFCKDQPQKRVPIGPFFQAEVADWTDMDPKSLSSSIDDSKWLGTQHWPIPNLCSKSLNGGHPIGKGRPDSCNCKIPGSVQCIRFHVAEKRLQLKLELGSTFYDWKFDRIGEEVSLLWTEEEEQRFKATLLQNPSIMDKNFWKVAGRSFPSRSRQNFVSYYYNVFLLRRRSYQNHVTPNNIDSDDEESEFSWVSSSFSDDTVKLSDSKPIFCTETKQCMDLEEDEDIR